MGWGWGRRKLGSYHGKDGRAEKCEQTWPVTGQRSLVTVWRGKVLQTVDGDPWPSAGARVGA